MAWAKHTDLPDGRAEVEYSDGTVVIYPDRSEASMGALQHLFPGTSREWLERMHRRGQESRALAECRERRERGTG